PVRVLPEFEQGRAGDGRQLDGVLASALRRPEVAVPSERLPYVQLPADEVQVLPLQTGDLADAERLVQCDDDDRREPGGRSRVREQRALLVRRKDALPTLARLRRPSARDLRDGSERADLDCVAEDQLERR